MTQPRDESTQIIREPTAAHSALNDDDYRGVAWSIAERCRHSPEAVAVYTSNGERRSYGELWQRVCRRAAYLHEEIVRRSSDERYIDEDTIVVVALDRNTSIEWSLAALTLRAVFAAIDPTQPLAQTHAALRRLASRPLVFVADASLEIEVDDDELFDRILAVDDAALPSYAPDIDVGHVASADLAYIAFTSGTTSASGPRAVCVEHRSLWAFAERSRAQLEITAASRVGHSVNTAFDVSVFTVFTTLFAGASLVMLDELIDFVDERRLYAAIGADDDDDDDKRRPPLTHLFLTSAIFNALSSSRLQSLAVCTRWLIVGGETPLSASLRVVRAAGVRVSQIYGPTETTVWATIVHYDDISSDECEGRLIGECRQSCAAARRSSIFYSRSVAVALLPHDAISR